MKPKQKREALKGRNRSNDFCKKIGKSKRSRKSEKEKILIICEDKGSLLTLFYDLSEENNIREKFVVSVVSCKGGDLHTLSKKLNNALQKDGDFTKVFCVYDLDRAKQYPKEAEEFKKQMSEIRNKYKKIDIEEIRSNPFSEIHLLQYFTKGGLSKYGNITKICIKLNSWKKVKCFSGGKLNTTNIKSQSTKLWNDTTKKLIPALIKNSKLKNVEEEFGSEIYKIFEYFKYLG